MAVKDTNIRVTFTIDKVSYDRYLSICKKVGLKPRDLLTYFIYACIYPPCIHDDDSDRS